MTHTPFTFKLSYDHAHAVDTGLYYEAQRLERQMKRNARRARRVSELGEAQQWLDALESSRLDREAALAGFA